MNKLLHHFFQYGNCHWQEFIPASEVNLSFGRVLHTRDSLIDELRRFVEQIEPQWRDEVEEATLQIPSDMVGVHIVQADGTVAYQFYANPEWEACFWNAIRRKFGDKE